MGFVASLVVALFLLQSALGQTVTIANGTVQGGTCSTTSKAKFYQSIPYAQPPINELRFSAPLPYNRKFNGTLDGTKTAVNCMQFGTNFIESGTQSEDCLVLNVWTPANATSSAKLPVKVWLYGGGNAAGSISNPTYNGCNLATDSVVVSANYRLGPLGFLAVDGANMTGNFAIQDQLLALRWVQDNVAAFGGDPKKVLLFGQSAGAADTFVLSSLPQAPSLMKAAAIESGGGRNLSTAAQAKSFFDGYVQKLGCSTSDAKCIRSKSNDELQKPLLADTSSILSSSPSTFSGFGPIIDGKIVAENPGTTGPRVPSILGFTSLEATLFTVTMFLTAPTAANYTSFVNRTFGALAPMILKQFPLSAYSTVPSAKAVSDSSQDLASWYAMNTLLTQRAFTCPTRRFLRSMTSRSANSTSAPMWIYIFNTQPSCRWYTQLGLLPDPIFNRLGATHTSEIPFVFANTESQPLPNGTCKFNFKEVALSQQMVAAWTSMAESGNASIKGLDWPAFGAGGSGIRGLNVTAAVATSGELDFSACDFWDGVEAQIARSGGNGTAGASPTGSVVPATGSSSQKAANKRALFLVAALSLGAAAMIF